MAAIRQAGDTGVEIKPVEIWLNQGGVPVLMTAQPCTDGGVLTQEGVNVRALNQVQVNGQFERRRMPGVFKALNAVAAGTETAVWTPSAGKKFRLLGYHLAASATGNIILRDNTGGTIIAVVPVAAGGPGIFVSLGNGILSAAASNVLTATGPGGATLSGLVVGSEE